MVADAAACDEVVFTGHVDDDELLRLLRGGRRLPVPLRARGVLRAAARGHGLRASPSSPTTRARSRRRCGGGGVLLKDKQPELVAELLHAVRTDRRAARGRCWPRQARRARGSARRRLRRAAAWSAWRRCSRAGGRAPVRVDQWVPALHRGDAIGDSARLMRDAFRSLGPHRRRVRAGAGRRARRATAGPGREWRPGGPDDVVILHYALPSPMTAALAAPTAAGACCSTTTSRRRSSSSATTPRWRASARWAARSCAAWPSTSTWAWPTASSTAGELEAAGFRAHGRAAHLPGLRALPASRRARCCARAAAATAARTCSSWAAWRPTSGTRT